LIWEVVDASNDALLFRGLGGGSVALRGQALGLDLKTALLQRMRTSLFDPEAMVVRREVAKTRSKRKAGRRRPSKLPEGNVSSQPDVFTRFGEVTTPSGVFGYIRLKSFSPESEDVDGTVEEFARILRAMPASGLILDVRGNPGGFINIGERSLQLLTPKAIQPEPFHFVASPQTLAMATTRNGLQEWAEPIKRGIETGAGFSQGFPLTSIEACNDIGQVYQGPVVLITDALCYSTTDMFAAGFQDHAIGRILGVHQATGAGGANVWDHADHLVRLRLDKSPYVALPRNAGMSVAVRRSTRVGMRSGVPLEDLGVSRDEKYEMTLTDVLKHNVDLIAHAAKILKALPKQTLSVTPATDAPVSRVRVGSTGIDRLDFCVDGRPVASVDVAGAAMTVTIPSAKRGSVIKGEGYRRGELVASTRVKVR
jgi:hypothetical protein